MALTGQRSMLRGKAMLRSGIDVVLFLLLIGFGCLELAEAQELQNCSFSAVYSFGDSLTDNGNAIAALPEQFIDSESNPNGVNFPHHAADRYCDGRLLVDYIGEFRVLVLIHCIHCRRTVFVRFCALCLCDLRNLDFGFTEVSQI